MAETTSRYASGDRDPVVASLTADVAAAAERVAAFLAARAPMTNIKARFGAGLDPEVIASAGEDADPLRELRVSDLRALLAASDLRALLAALGQEE